MTVAFALLATADIIYGSPMEQVALVCCERRCDPGCHDVRDLLILTCRAT
jgi:hypothetical protein